MTHRGGGGCIFRSIGLGLEGKVSRRCSPNGSRDRVPSAPTELEAPRLLRVKSAQWWPGHAPLARMATVG